MTLAQLRPALMQGKKVSRTRDGRWWVELEGDSLLIYTPSKVYDFDEEEHFCGLNSEDILADDWEVLGVDGVKTCEGCKHSRWFGEYAMQVCEKHGKSNPSAACEDYEKKGDDGMTVEQILRKVDELMQYYMDTPDTDYNCGAWDVLDQLHDYIEKGGVE